MTTFKELTRKEQIEHIWEYYKFHILGILFGLFIIIQVLTLIFGPKPPKPIANVVIMGKYIQDDEKINKIQDEIQNIIDGGEHGKVELSMFPVNWEQPSQLTMAMEQKLVLMLQAQEVDALIIEKEKFDSYITHSDTSPFEALDEFPSLATVLEENKENLIKHKFNDEKQEKVYGISVVNNPKLQEIGLNNNYIIIIPSIAPNKDNAVKIIEWFYE